MNKQFFRSVKAQLALLVLISLVPVLVIFIYTAIKSNNQVIEDAKEDALSVVNDVAFQQRQVTESTRQLLMTLTKVHDVRNQNIPSCNRIFGELVKANPLYADIFAANADGLILSSGRPFVPYNIKERKYFKDILRIHDYAVGEYIVGGITKRAVLPFAYPIIGDDRRINGLVVAGIDLQRYGNLFSDARLPAGSELALTDHQGIRLYTQPEHEINVGKADASHILARMSGDNNEGAFTASGNDGLERLFAYKSLRLRDNESPYLFIRVSIPKKTALAYHRKLLFRNLAVLGFACIAALIAAWVIGSLIISRQVRRLTETTQSLGLGDLKARTGLKYEGGELGQLAKAFDEMAHKLEQKETDRKTAEEALKESQERYQTAIEYSNDGVALVEGDKLIYVNKRMVEMFGYASSDELIGQTVAVTVHPDDSEMVLSINRKRQKGEHVPSKYEFKGVKRDGSVVYIEVSATRVNYKGVSVALAYLRDATERKLSEELLKETEDKYRSIFENAVEGMFQTTPDGRFIAANPALARIYGFQSPQELLDNITDVANQMYVKPEDRKILQNLYATQGFVSNFITQLCRKDGEKIWISMSARAVKDVRGEIVHYEGTVEDITQSKELEDALKMAEREKSLILNAIPEVVIFHDCDMKILWVNKTARDLLASRTDDFVGRFCYEVWHNCDYICEGCPIKKALTTGRPQDGELKSPSGKIWYVHGYPVRTNDGSLVGVVEIRLDITERKQMEVALSQSEEKYRDIFENAVEGIFQTTPEGHYLQINPALARMYGYNSPEELMANVRDIGRQIYVDPEDRIRLQQTIEKNGSFEGFEAQQYRKDGSKIWTSSNARVVLDTDGNTLYYEGIVENITDRKHLESQLLQAQKMEAIGTLAGGIAHDFNNILSALIGYGNLMHMKMDADDPLKIYVEHMLVASEKAVNLTHSLLTFSRKQVMRLQPQKMSTMVRSIEKILLRLLTEDIELKVTTSDTEITVLADVTQIDQVLLNLAANARDAMPQGGTLRIETSEVEINQEFIRSYGYGVPGKYALISISDTGTGLDEKTRQKIFEPFFTTKEVGKGTGLGLSIVYGIIKQHNGYINVTSELDKGTTFHIYLPVVTTSTEETKLASIDVKGGTETILLAEDNPDLQKLQEEVLNSKGYTTIAATDGEMAIARFMELKDSIDLLILDVVMPKKNGKEVFDEIRKIRPDVKVLFTSGYTGDVVIDKGVYDSAVEFIQKPTSPNELLGKIREVLDKKVKTS
jgi:PAS domain S-box-containing protein